MKKTLNFLLFAGLILMWGCSVDGALTESTADQYLNSNNSSDPGNPGSQPQAGLITAGEWNDLDNWDFWTDLMGKEEFSQEQNTWGIFPKRRIAVVLKDAGQVPQASVDVVLKVNGSPAWTAKTDNLGRAELWLELFEEDEPSIDLASLELDIAQGAKIVSNFNFIENGVNEILLGSAVASTPDNSAEIAFVVDATGSMGDELEFLKVELKDVIQRVQDDNPSSSIRTASVFYRDEDDNYVTKHSNFSSDIDQTIDFISAQSAGGGGDFPEAVHSALNVATQELQWSDAARTKIVFLLLDAPPHQSEEVISDIHQNIIRTAESGIKIIPITASGIDKSTEMLMRFLSIATNGTYVFITDHSGIGNEHLEATVGAYDVEFLNELMVRLLNKYLE